MKRTLVTLAGVLALAAAACGGGEEPTAPQAEEQAESLVVPASPAADCVDATGEKTVEVELVDATTISPSCLIVSADQQFDVRNVDEFTGHTLTISELEYHRTPFILDSGRLAAGARVTLDLGTTGVEPGGYPLFCIYHPLMKGEIYVR